MKFKNSDYKPTLNTKINKSKNDATMNSNTNMNSSLNKTKKYKEDESKVIKREGKIN